MSKIRLSAEQQCVVDAMYDHIPDYRVDGAVNKAPGETETEIYTNISTAFICMLREIELYGRIAEKDLLPLIQRIEFHFGKPYTEAIEQMIQEAQLVMNRRTLEKIWD